MSDVFLAIMGLAIGISVNFCLMHYLIFKYLRDIIRKLDALAKKKGEE